MASTNFTSTKRHCRPYLEESSSCRLNYELEESLAGWRRSSLSLSYCYFRCRVTDFVDPATLDQKSRLKLGLFIGHRSNRSRALYRGRILSRQSTVHSCRGEMTDGMAGTQRGEKEKVLDIAELLLSPRTATNEGGSRLPSEDKSES